MTGRERRNLLNKLAQLVEDNADELAVAESQDNGSIVVISHILHPSYSPVDFASNTIQSFFETGKPVSIAKAVDVASTAEFFRYFAGWADRLEGKQSPIDGVCCALRITHDVCVFTYCSSWCR
jgi:phenylacetaldehyde dehydrogenase